MLGISAALWFAVATAPAVSEQPKSRWELGVTPRGGMLFGLDSATPGRFSGFTGELELDLRSRSGAMVVTAFRWTGFQQGRLRMQRYRIGIGMGYAMRRGPFELMGSAMFTVEPWLASSRAGAIELVRTPEGQVIGPMFGGVLQFSPGIYLRPKSRVALRVGPHIALSAGSFGKGVGSASLEQADGSRYKLPIGGLEASVGADATMWFGRAE